jgi:hypothetical protein
MKKALIFFLLFMAFGAQAQVIPVGFMKNRGYVNIPTPNPPPVTNGLILYLDATQSASYSGSGTTWNDVSGQSPAGPATLAGSPPPTFSSGSTANGSGSFTFAANKNAKTTKTFTIQQAITFIAWINPSQTVGGSGNSEGSGVIVRRWDPSNQGGATGLFLWGGNALGYDWANNYYGTRFGLTVPNNEWSMVAISVNATSVTAYLCKASGITSGNVGNTHPNLVTSYSAPASHFTIGYDGYSPANRALVGKMAIAMVYYTPLNSTEIESIFNAQKASFGL